MKSFLEKWSSPRRYDVVLFVPVVCLVGIGIVMVFSASGVPAADRTGNELYYLVRQSMWAGLGIVGLLVAAHLPYPRLARLAPLMLVGALLLLVAIKIPGLGATRGGATRWFALGSVSFQPSELAKLAVIFYLARYYADRKELMTFKEAVLKPAIIVCPIILLVLIQPDYGTAVALAALFAIMAFAAGARVHHLAAAGLVIAPGLAALVYFAPYRMRRLITFVNPWEDMSDSGFQIIQSFLAFSGGGITGRGLGDGLQKLYFLPEAHSDFVLSLVAEELGLLGVALVLVCFALIGWRGMSIALNHGDSLGRMLAVGLTSIIGLQALINIMVVTGMLPTKGITLPFVSYGGSSLVVMMTAAGLLMNVSAHLPEEKE